MRRARWHGRACEQWPSKDQICPGDFGPGLGNVRHKYSLFSNLFEYEPEYELCFQVCLYTTRTTKTRIRTKNSGKPISIVTNEAYSIYSQSD